MKRLVLVILALSACYSPPFEPKGHCPLFIGGNKITDVYTQFENPDCDKIQVASDYSVGLIYSVNIASVNEIADSLKDSGGIWIYDTDNLGRPPCIAGCFLFDTKEIELTRNPKALTHETLHLIDFYNGHSPSSERKHVMWETDPRYGYVSGVFSAQQRELPSDYYRIIVPQP